jgi:DNA-binding CsgD family transcriptional regulator/tetratricopeptide (TPR) repeat protein
VDDDVIAPHLTVGDLVGRAADLAVVRDFVDTAAAGGAALLLTGEPGVGKSVILDAAEELARASGATLLQVTGLEFEAQVGLAGLDRLLTPLRPHLSGLPDGAGDALAIALGLRDGPAPDRLLISNSALALLRLGARARALLMVIDDAHWLDRASALTLTFIARRLTGTRVGLLIATRSGAGGVFEESGLGLPRHHLEPLDGAAAGLLLGSRFPGLARRVHRRLLAEAQGNPLALVELPAGLNPDQQSGHAPLPKVPQLSGRLGTLFADRITRLPVPARRMLLLAALQGTGDLQTIASAYAADTGPALTAARDAGLIEVDEDAQRLRFRHPTVRSTIVEMSADIERRRAHRALASILSDGSDQVWHRAAAASTADAEVADALERVAEQAMRRGDTAGAIAAMERAAELSPAAADQARLLNSTALIGAEVTGDLHRAAQLIDQAQAADPELVGSLSSAVTAAHLLFNSQNDIDAAHRLLVAAIKLHPRRRDPRDEVLISALFSLVMLCFNSGRPELWEPLDRAMADLVGKVPPLLRLSHRTFGDPARLTAPILELATPVIDALHDEFDPVRIARTAVACVFIDRISECRPALWRVVQSGREGGSVGLAINALLGCCIDDWQGGQWDRLLRLADEGIELCRIHGYRRYSRTLRGHLKSLVAAARGQDLEATAEELVDGDRVVMQHVHSVRGLAALGVGDDEVAYRELASISPPGTLAPFTPMALWVLLDLVEAAVRTGRLTEARAHVRVMLELNIAAISGRLALISAGCAAMVTADEESTDRYEQALAVPGAERWPFEFARIRLAYGRHLHRVGAPSDSRFQIEAAYEAFDGLAAVPWRDRAGASLRAIGGKPAISGRTAEARLTAQERRIATLAASGLTNKEIGARLHLSPRTVGSYLYQSFPKLGITSRAALRDALRRAGVADAQR